MGVHSQRSQMRIIALEEHYIMPSEEQNLPPGAHRGNDREKLLGFDVVAGLLDLGAPIYLHPSRPHPAVMQAYFDGYEELAWAAWGFGIDTGAHFLRLVFAGVFDAFPNLTLILGHLGEGLPFMLHRIQDQTQLAAARRGLKRRPAQYLTENLVVTCGGDFSPPPLLF